MVGSGAATPTYAPSTSAQFEGALLRNRSLGQDILPSPGQPKRTESLYVTPGRGSTASGGGGGAGPGLSKVSPLPLLPTLVLSRVSPPSLFTLAPRGKGGLSTPPYPLLRPSQEIIGIIYVNLRSDVNRVSIFFLFCQTSNETSNSSNGIVIIFSLKFCQISKHFSRREQSVKINVA